MNRLTLFLIVVAALTNVGCSRKHSIAVPGLTMNTPAPAVARTIMVAGQSNAVRLDPAGYAGWNSIHKANDTFINCAENGTTLAQWDPHGSRFSKCVQMTQGQKVDLILWSQGESDADPALAGAGASPVGFDARTTGLFRAFRDQWGNVPILFAQIGVVDTVKLPDFVDWQSIKDSQARISFPNAYMIKTDDITAGSPLKNDGIHWDDPGYYQIGIRYAQAFTGIE